MRNIIIILLAVCVNSFQGYSQEFNIRVNINNVTDGTKFYLIHSIEGKADTVGTAVAKNNKFSFNGQVAVEAEFYWLKMDKVNSYITLLLDNSTIAIDGDVKKWPNLQITGSPSHSSYQAMSAYIYANSSPEKIQDLFNKRHKIVDTLSTPYKLYTDSINRSKSVFYRDWELAIELNPNSAWTPVLISKYAIWDAKRKKEAFLKLSRKAQMSKYGRELLRDIEIEEKTEMVKIGGTLPNFESISLEGKSVRIGDIIPKAKLTLIDFWGSWCAPCRKEIPNIRRVYEAFKNKGFNILGIGLESDVESWKKAIDDDQMNWTHVSQLRLRNEDAARIFGINGVPSYVLVDEHGNIVEMDLPGSRIKSSVGSLQGEVLYKKIEELLEKSK